VSPEVARHAEAIERLCRQFHVRRLELFGSSAREDRDGGRDVDLLVEFDPLPRGEYANAYFGLLESLQHLLGRDVDLVIASAITNPYFLQSIEQTKTLLYAA